MPSSTYNKTKTKTYIKILRHISPGRDLSNTYRKFQVSKWLDDGDIHVKEIVMEIVYFLIDENIM